MMACGIEKKETLFYAQVENCECDFHAQYLIDALNAGLKKVMSSILVLIPFASSVIFRPLEKRRRIYSSSGIDHTLTAIIFFQYSCRDAFITLSDHEVLDKEASEIMSRWDLSFSIYRCPWRRIEQVCGHTPHMCVSIWKKNFFIIARDREIRYGRRESRCPGAPRWLFGCMWFAQLADSLLLCSLIRCNLQ
jgi:hypothetical protein